MTAIICLLLSVVATSAYSNNQQPQGGHGGPPPEAIKACDGKKVGDSTSFKGRQGETLQATCKEIEGKLAAVPAGGPEGGPPQQK